MFADTSLHTASQWKQNAVVIMMVIAMLYHHLASEETGLCRHRELLRFYANNSVICDEQIVRFDVELSVMFFTFISLTSKEI